MTRSAEHEQALKDAKATAYRWMDGMPRKERRSLANRAQYKEAREVYRALAEDINKFFKEKAS